jgi:hypothetical protein
VLVDSNLRRSLRIKAYNTWFKAVGCGKKNCLGCELDPPPLSSKVIKNLGASFCQMDPKDLSDTPLKTSHTARKTIKKAQSKAVEGPEPKKGQKKSQNSSPNGDKSKKNIREKNK